MKTFLLIVSFIAAARAGLQVGKVESEAIRINLHGGPSDQGLEGETMWSCTRIHNSTTTNEESHGWGREQLVFVQQEPTHYKHKVIIKDIGKKQGNTTVYVIPANNTHEIALHADEVPQELNKPSFFFLKNHPFQTEGLPQ